MFGLPRETFLNKTFFAAKRLLFAGITGRLNDKATFAQLTNKGVLHLFLAPSNLRAIAQSPSDALRKI